MTTTKQAKLSLVGAGPGDPDLITLKATKVLQSADVVLYDALSNPAILKWAPKSAQKIFVGKRAGQYSLKQDEINRLIVEYALQYGHVVRLKGGDPFIFGRGHEELQHAEAFGISCQVIPGISSSTALSALQKTPLTRRGMSQSFWVMTATNQANELTQDISLAAQSSATVVILMGLRKLQKITALFAAQGKGNLAAMIIQNGSLPNEEVTIGTVNTITDQFQDRQNKGPGIIIIGEVVSLHPAYLHYETVYRQEKEWL